MTPVAQPDRAQVNALYRVARLLGAAVTATTFRRSCRSCQVGDDLLGSINTAADTIKLYCANCTEAEIVAAFNLTLADLSCAADRAALNGHAADDGDGFVWLDDLLDEPDALHRWVIDGLFTVGGLSFLNARPGAGKSTLIRNVCAAVAAGLPVLGRNTTQGTVLLLSHEEQREELKRKFRQLGMGRGLKLAIFCDPAPEQAVTWLRQSIEKYRPSLVVIDTLSACFGIEDLNSNSEMSAHLKQVMALGHQSGTHICIVHWTGKNENGPLGATSILGTADLSLTMSQDTEKRRYLETDKVRTGVPIKKTMLLLDPDTGRVSLAGEYDWIQREMCGQAIITSLGNNALGSRDLIEMVGRREGVFYQTINELTRRGLIRADNGRNGAAVYRVRSGGVTFPLFGGLGSTGSDGSHGSDEPEPDPEEQVI